MTPLKLNLHIIKTITLYCDMLLNISEEQRVPKHSGALHTWCLILAYFRMI